MSKLKVHVLFEHGTDLKPYGVAYIRDILPLSHPANEGAFDVTCGTDYARADVVVLERLWKPGISMQSAEILVERLRKDRSILVYSIDDNLLDLDAIPVQDRMVVRFFCREADGILVSTEYLQGRLEHLNENIFLLPNAIDERLFKVNGKRLSPRKMGAGPKIIGFVGTFTHDADLMMVLQPLRRILRKYGGSLKFQLVGGVSDQTVTKAFKGLPLQMLQVPVRDVGYPNFVSWMKKNLSWDLGIAPLENSRFTRSKSDIKFLDYSALAIPGIYSEVPTYTKTVRHMDTGYLAPNTPGGWGEALECLLEDDDLRFRLATRAQEYVFSTRSLEGCAPQWRAAIEHIVNLR